ncbi:helix-turn-helix domain-containing protein [Clostridium butyricum]|uniref:helix-turn-helix domain-containing protein n=1 Tax=Clostridium butyricum TaxID=1492 RepID=UPI002AB17C96|nr:helix-turn-helix transcriptional regulator [Clostridium butyricum]
MVKINLKNLMSKKDITQKKLSEDTGIGANTINRYTNNTFVRIDGSHIEILCDYFNCSIDELIKLEK